MKIALIQSVLNSKRFASEVALFEAVETKKTFKTEKKNIKKSDIGVIKTNLIERHNFFMYYVWCLPEEVEEERKKLESFVLEKFHKVRKEFNDVAIQVSLYEVRQW